jgi:hypothetical protein
MEEAENQSQQNDTGLEAFKLLKPEVKQEIQVPKRDQDALVEATSDNSLSVVGEIRNTSILDPEAVKDLEKSKQFLLSTYTDVPMYRPMVVKLASVLNDKTCPTNDSKYWQCKKEAEVHFNELVGNVYKWHLSQIDLEEMDYKIASLEKLLEEPDGIRSDIDPVLIGFDLRRLKVKRERYEFNVKQLEKNIKYRIEEVTDWAAIAGKLETQCQGSTTNAQQHVAMSLLATLEHKVEEAKKNNDQKAVENYESQLNTLKRMLYEKSKEILKEKGGN